MLGVSYTAGSPNRLLSWIWNGFLPTWLEGRLVCWDDLDAVRVNVNHLPLHLLVGLGFVPHAAYVEAERQAIFVAV